ncbi:amino acid adenylation domain-containing protein [bacterium]|nr:amino acid adenylation domain-containing protein [bacterium]
MSRPLYEGFLASSQRFPDRSALNVCGQSVAYADLCLRARRIAATIQRHLPRRDPRLTAVFAYRSPTAYAGVLGALLSGDGVVPLNPMLPVERTRFMLARSGACAVIVDDASAPDFQAVAEGMSARLLLIFPNNDDVGEIRESLPGHDVLAARDLEPGGQWRRDDPPPDRGAYLLFTSGSTGTPKGVMVAHRNIVSFIDYVVERYGITERDRFSQMHDPTFDPAYFDMFAAWERGACVCCPTKKETYMPGTFINRMQLTVWFFTPSTAVIMKRLGMLKPGTYPTLRWSLFGSEALPVSVAEAWAAAAPNSIVENVYGPTELTVACTFHRWDPVASRPYCEQGIVPIGSPNPGMRALVVDEELREVAPGEVGELLMNGPQMSLGYWRDPDKTAAAFITPPGHADTYYRTGDRVRRAVDGGPMTYRGRVDFQVKILGHRVELGEIEAVVREEAGLDGVVAMGWPLTDMGVGGIVAFLEGSAPGELAALARRVGSRLPAHMVPRKFMFLDRIPLNPNGKYDRHALRRILEAQP